MNPRDMALALAVTTVIADYAADQKDALRAELLASLDELGADSVRAELYGEKIAKSAIVAPSRKPVVVNEQAFTAWVAENFATEIETRVREAFKKVLLDRVIEADEQVAVDPETGEVIPGINFVSKSAYISTRFEKGGRDAVIAAFQSGALTLSQTFATPELEA